MIRATFRFYAQLNDFLPACRRQRRVAYVIPAPASVKDAIEALGVPHTEADVILVNARDEDFAYRLLDGDDVSVYPAFRSIDIAGLLRVGRDPPEPVRFVLDAHLRKLASFLRLAGFDASLLAEDADIATTAAREQRVVLTRDVGLLKRSLVLYGYWVRQTDPDLQLAEVLERFALVTRMQPFTRCLRCNTPVRPVDADAVAARLPPRVRMNFQQFHACPVCGRIYWEGSHYNRLMRLIERAREIPQRPRD